MRTQIAVLVCSSILAGCASVTPPLAEFDGNARYMPVALVINDGTIDSTRTSIGYTSMTIVDQTSFVLKDELSKTGVFELVELNNPYQEVVLNVTFTRKNVDENIAKSVVQGGTLFLLPTTDKWKTSAKIVVRVRAEIVKSYEYELESVQRVFLGDDPYAERRSVAQALWSRFLADAQKARLFEDVIPESLYRQRPPNQAPQHNAGSRLSAGESPASETPSAPAPRGCYEEKVVKRIE